MGETSSSTKHDTATRALRESRQRSDSWYNSRSRFGGRSDPVIVSSFVRSKGRITRDEAEALFEHDWLSSRIVTQLPEDATREWIELTHDKDPKKAELLRKEDERLDGRGMFAEGMTWGRLQGSALLIMGAWDGGAPEEPLDLKRMQKFNYAHVVDKWLAFPQTWYNDPEEEKFGKAEIYRVHRLSAIGSPTSLVHETRTIKFDGSKLPPLAHVRNWGWGGSVLDKVYDVLRNWGISNQAAASVIPAFITYAVQIGNLQELLMNKDWASIQARIGEMQAQMSTNNMAIYGEGETIQKMGTPVTGLPDLMDKFMEIVSGAADIPKSILFQAESGAMGGNAAGSDQRNWYNRVAAHQEVVLRPKVRAWLDTIGAPLGLEPGEVEFTFKELTQVSDEEKTDLYKKTMDADQVAINSGLIDSPERLAVFRFGGTVFNSAPPVLDVTRQEKFVKLLDKEPVELPQEEDEGDGGDDGGGGGPTLDRLDRVQDDLYEGLHVDESRLTALVKRVAKAVRLGSKGQ
jgi:hypothetical protein